MLVLAVVVGTIGFWLASFEQNWPASTGATWVSAALAVVLSPLVVWAFAVFGWVWWGCVVEHLWFALGVLTGCGIAVLLGVTQVVRAERRQRRMLLVTYTHVAGLLVAVLAPVSIFFVLALSTLI